MKILSAKECKLVDQYTIENEPITSIDLMERAAIRLVDWIIHNTEQSKTWNIFAGPGNNGGDALAMARLLNNTDHARSITVVKCFFEAQKSAECAINLDRISAHSGVELIDFDPKLLEESDYILDGIFGIGLSRPILPPFEDVIHYVNKTKAIVLAIDFPSGLLSDKTPHGSVIKADYTLSIGNPKLALFLPQSFDHVGYWESIDINLHPDALANAKTNYQTIDKALVKDLYRPKNKFDHKGSNGTCLLVCGSSNMTGAAILAAQAAMRSGAGKVHVHSVPGAINALRSILPEAILHVAHPNKQINLTLRHFQSIGVGCGTGTSLYFYRALQSLMLEFGKPMVIDADALNLLSRSTERLKLIPKNSILTPHPKEFERLFGETVDDFDQIERLQTMAKTYEIIIILKGAHSAVALPNGKIYFNMNGNPGMATAGSGDVLTGILTALLAQGYKPSESALLGTYIHGLAGDLAFQKKGSYEGLIASDIIDSLPKAYGTLYK